MRNTSSRRSSFFITNGRRSMRSDPHKIESSCTVSDGRQTWSDIARGQLALVYVTPEKLAASGSFMNLLRYDGMGCEHHNTHARVRPRACTQYISLLVFTTTHVCTHALLQVSGRPQSAPLLRHRRGSLRQSGTLRFPLELIEFQHISTVNCLYPRSTLIGVDQEDTSQWGHDFRPDYLHLACLKKEFPNVRSVARSTLL